MNLNKQEIDKALDYYGIYDNDYKLKCYQCIQEVHNNIDFMKKVKEMYDILYIDKTYKIYALWKKQNMNLLFGDNYHPYITNVLVLLGYPLHEENMINKAYNDNLKELYKRRVHEALTNDIYDRKLEGIRISQMIWAAYFINTKIIEVGILQYEKREDYIKIHIPRGNRLEIDKVLDSIKKSKKEIEQYFGLINPEYRGDSWLLSNQINALIDPNSNIAKFYKLFEVKDGPDATSDILNFVFNLQECTDYHTLPENTSMQRLLKQQLIHNQELKIGCGKLKKIDKNY